MTWKQTSPFKWVRDDGAVVRWELAPTSAAYSASVDGSRGGLLRQAKPLGVERYRARLRMWRTPEAAMKAIDKEYPMRDAEPDNPYPLGYMQNRGAS